MASIFARLGSLISETAATAFAQVVEAVRTFFAGDPELRRKVAFSVAMIALSAKMAKADGVVTDAEVTAFRQIFHIPRDEERNVARLYNLAKQDVAGYEAYAAKLADLCGEGGENCTMLEDILDGLFHIARADGAIHQREMSFLSRVADIFQMEEAQFAAIAARHAVLGDGDPYLILGVTRQTPMGEIRKRYRQLASENHPDRMVARGLPKEFVEIANRRMAAINDAFAMIERSFSPA